MFHCKIEQSCQSFQVDCRLQVPWSQGHWHLNQYTLSTRMSAFFSRKAKQFANDYDKMVVVVMMMTMMIELFKDVGL